MDGDGQICFKEFERMIQILMNKDKADAFLI